MHKKQVLTSLTIWDRLGTSTTGDVRPASPAAAAPVVVGDEAEAERFFEENILCQWFSPEVFPCSVPLQDEAKEEYGELVSKPLDAEEEK